MISILLVDDHPLVREQLESLLRAENDLTVHATAGTEPEALDLLAEYRPDLLITDLSLSETSGLALTRKAQALQPDLPVLIVSSHSEHTYGPRAQEAGAAGYLTKAEAGNKISTAARHVAGGGRWFSGTIREAGPGSSGP